MPALNPEASFAVATAPKRDSLHWEQGTVTWAELLDWAAHPGTRKEAGNYILGTLVVGPPSPKCDCRTERHRTKASTASRSAITLDVDHPVTGFAEGFELTFPYAAILHTTFSSSPDDLRYRIIIPTDREMAPDEYIAAASALVSQLGAHNFDPSTTQPERYMFRPAAKQKGWYSHVTLDGPPAPVAALLAAFEPELGDKSAPSSGKPKRDPFEIDGVVGAFNRAYEDWDLLIETFELPYTKVDTDRYQLIGAVSQAGMGPVAGTKGLVFSHHSSDPAYGVTCSAFDLVRLHKFGTLDERTNPQTPINRLPSYKAMEEVATLDARVLAELVGLDFDNPEAEDDDDDTATPSAKWKLNLRVSNKGETRNIIANWDLIVEHDPVFALLYFNELTLSPEWTADPPWRKLDGNALVTATDRWEVAHYIERDYRLEASKQRIDAMIDTRAARLLRNPVREYLLGLEWDGKERVETCLPGVAPTEYTRLVARKSMVAAVARMLDPGCKWDHTLVLFGTEGLGKSWWVEKMAKGFLSELGRIDNKDTLLAMQRSWIMLADEGHSLKKGDADQLKEFLTRTADMFRMPYDREVVVHPRHCVIWSSTNDKIFLRRQEGNRRFLIVQCERKVDFDAITDAYVDQVWAEAVDLYRAGERLYLDDDETVVAAVQREEHIEEDALAGQIEEYLDMLVPADWWDRSPEARVQWYVDRDHGFEAEGVMQLDKVCSLQVWVECLRRRPGDHRRVDLLDITNTLKRIPGWVQASLRTRVPGYGPQTVFVREDLL